MRYIFLLLLTLTTGTFSGVKEFKLTTPKSSVGVGEAIIVTAEFNTDKKYGVATPTFPTNENYVILGSDRRQSSSSSCCRLPLVRVMSKLISMLKGCW